MSTIGGWKYEGDLYTRISGEYPEEDVIIGDGSDLVHIQVFEDGKLSYYCNGELIAAESFNSNRAKALPRCIAERIKERLQKEHPSAKICLCTYTRYIDSTQSTFVTPPKTVSPGYRYQWKYSDDEFCVRMVFYNFIYHHSHDVQEVVTKIYIHLNGAIKESSIHMKLSNIKYLLDEEGIESSMPDSSLSQVSNQCRRAFDRVYEEYKNNGYKIADPTKTSMPGAGPDGGPDLTPPPPPKPELPTYKIKVILNGETYFYRHNVHDNTNNLIKDFGFLRATALFQVESKITAEALQKQYPSAIIEIVENVSDR